MNRYVIFDLDGTLFDSMGFWEGVGRTFLGRYGIREFPADFNDRVKAMSIAEACRYFREDFDIDVTDEYTSNAMFEIVADKYRYEAEFKPNVRATLDTLRASGVKMCIATATYPTLVREALERLNATSYFEFVLSCQDVGAGKNEPKVFDTALERLGGDKSNTVIVEDALHAITTAKSNGYKVVAVEDSHQSSNRESIMALADVYLHVMDADTILSL